MFRKNKISIKYAKDEIGYNNQYNLNVIVQGVKIKLEQ